MPTKICLHHVGEVVLGSLLGTLSAEGELTKVRCLRHSDCTLDAILKEALVEAPYEFEANAKLSPTTVGGETLIFDGAHGVDVICRGANLRGFAIEAKLGLERLSAPEFTRRFLADVGFTEHNPRRVKGSMVSILNGRSIGVLGAFDLHVSQTELVTSWAIVIREAVWSNWRVASPAFAPAAHWLSFDQIASEFGEGEFDNAVKEILGDKFFRAWCHQN